MSIVEFYGPPSWTLDVGETGESTKMPTASTHGHFLLSTVLLSKQL